MKQLLEQTSSGSAKTAKDLKVAILYFEILRFAQDDVRGQASRNRAEEVYVAPFLREGERYQVSSSGGNVAIWSADGHELYYMTEEKQIAAVRVSATSSHVSATKPEVLFRAPGLVNTGTAFQTPFAVSDDGRFLLNVTPPPAVPPSITAVLHWR